MLEVNSFFVFQFTFIFMTNLLLVFESSINYRKLILKEVNFNDFKNIHYFIESNLFHQYYLLNLYQLEFFQSFLNLLAEVKPLHLMNFFLYVVIKLLHYFMDLNFFLLLLDSNYYFDFFINLLFYLILFYSFQLNFLLFFDLMMHLKYHLQYLIYLMKI